jgi:TatA/E family protein of Tat protein translocase
MQSLAFLGLNNIGPFEGLVLLALGLLLFGKRLPEVGRSLGKGIVEFKRGLKGVADEIEDQSNKDAAVTRRGELPANNPQVNTNFAATKETEEVRVSRGEQVE